MRERYAEENADLLEARGLEATPGNIYLAHLLGPLGAAEMLGADPATAADKVNPEAAAKNKSIFYTDSDTGRPLSAGEFATWAKARMDGTALADWGRRLDALRPELKLAIAKDAGIKAMREAADAAMAEKAAHEDRLEETEAEISKGEFGLADLDKAHDGGKGWLKDEGDRERLKSAIERHADEVAGYEAAVTKFLTPGYVFDAGSAEDQEAVDLLYRLGPSQGGAGLSEGDTRATALLQRLVTRTGIVPTGAEGFVEADVASYGVTTPSSVREISVPQETEVTGSDLPSENRQDNVELAQLDDDGSKKLQDYLRSIGRRPQHDPLYARPSHPRKKLQGQYEIRKDYVSFPDMIAAANSPDRNGFTASGRGLQKHVSRLGSRYQLPKMTTAEEYNREAAKLVDRILKDPDNMVVRTRDGRTEVWDSQGTFGIKFNRDGTFYTFREPLTGGN
jgi:hypothetical protein